MEFKAEQIAELIKGDVVGDPNITVKAIAKIEEGKPGSICFLSNPNYEKYIYTTEASVVIVNKTFKPEHPIKATLIKVDDAYTAVANLMQMYADLKPRKTGIEQPSSISTSATIGDFAYIGAFSYIGDNVKIGNNVSIYPNAYVGDNVVIGDNCIVYPNVSIYHSCEIGNNCTIHSGTSIGADGFGFAPGADGEYTKIPQLGNVVLEDNVEIGANTCIDRATMGSTIVGKGTKIDNLVQVAHNVRMGKNNVIAAISGVAGSSVIGNNCMFGGMTGIAGHLKVGDNVKTGAYTGVGSNAKSDSTLRGMPALDYKTYTRSYIHFKQLPQTVADIKELKEEIKKLKGE